MGIESERQRIWEETRNEKVSDVFIALVKAARSSAKTNLCQITHKISHVEGNPVIRFTRNKDKPLRESTQQAAQMRSRNQLTLLSEWHQNLRQSRVAVVSQILCALYVCVCNVLFSLRVLSKPALLGFSPRHCSLGLVLDSNCSVFRFRLAGFLQMKTDSLGHSSQDQVYWTTSHISRSRGEVFFCFTYM